MREKVLFLGMLAILLTGAGPVSGADSWQVTVAEGDVFLLPADEVDWRIAGPSDRLAPGDRLWAAPAGRAAAAGPAGLTLRLDQETQVELAEDGARQ
ncbi:MAG: hypothetical protein AB1515_04220, partial [Nitrospirota bacterium]